MPLLTDSEWRAIQPDFPSMWGDLRGVEFSQGWLDCGGIETRYLHAGDKSKPVLVLLHGVSGHAEAYIRNLRAHAQHFSTYAIDMVGHGWSGKGSGPLEIDHYIDHVLAFIEAIGAQKVHLSGESLGGWVAARLASRHPEKIDRLVLNTMGGSRADPNVMGKIKSLTMQAAKDPSWDFMTARIQWLMFDNADATEDLIACRQAIFRQPNMEQIAEDLMILQDPEVRDRNLLTDEELASIKAPTMVLWTSHDPSGPASEGERVSRLIAGSRFEVMQNCGHWPQWENVEEFDRIHIGFLLGE